jgi:hypothetical protein
VEIDLVVERPGENHLFIEIKSSKEVDENSLKNLKKLSEDFGNCEALCFSRDKFSRKIGQIQVLNWKEGIKKYFS